MTQSFDLSFKLCNKDIISIGILVCYTFEYVTKEITIIEEIGKTTNLFVVINSEIINNLRLDDRLKIG